MILEALKRLHSDPKFLDEYGSGIAALKRSGIFEALRLLGQPHLVFDGKDANALASQASRSVGWNAAINTLLSFEALIDEAVTAKTSPTMGYGGLEAAVKRGDLLQEEADAIKFGRGVDPAAYKPKPTPGS